MFSLLRRNRRKRGPMAFYIGVVLQTNPNGLRHLPSIFVHIDAPFIIAEFNRLPNEPGRHFIQLLVQGDRSIGFDFTVLPLQKNRIQPIAIFDERHEMHL